jgi:hypothetical protein
LSRRCTKYCEMDFDKVFLFRISSAFSVLGVSLIFFLLGGLSKERSNALFTVVHAFSSGILLGMGFLFDDPDSIFHMNHESTHTAVYIASLSFVAMLGIEYFNAASSYDYSAVVTVDDSEDSEFDFAREVELSNLGNVVIDEEEDGAVVSIGRSKSRGFVSQLVSKSFTFHPLMLLFFASASDMVGGIHLSSEEHYGVQLLLVVLVHKALMACAFGTLLESSTAPRSIFLYFMLTYSSSSAIGILTGTLMSKYGFVTPRLLRSLRVTDHIVTALTAGVYLFIAAMKMIPASLADDRRDQARVAGVDVSEKWVRFSVFVGGFLFAVVPKMLIQ